MVNPVFPLSWPRSRGGFAAVIYAVGGFASGVVFRLLLDLDADRNLPNFLRSGLHGVGFAMTVFVLQAAAGAGSRFGARLRRRPLAVDVLIRVAIMAVALVVVGVVLQLILYGSLWWRWVTTNLPVIVAVGFGFSFVVNVVTEVVRLISAPLLVSVLLGSYKRPRRQMLIVMFLDLANSTRLAETMGELKVHDLITRFFLDIDGPIARFGGTVHNYVGDEVIVSWPISDKPAQNGRCIACYGAIEAKIAGLAPVYQRDFGVVPAFRAGIHAGAVVVSECGDAKRQLAYYGDTMNVAARLCELCKPLRARLVISRQVLALVSPCAGVGISEERRLEVRGRAEPVGVHIVGGSAA